MSRRRKKVETESYQRGWIGAVFTLRRKPKNVQLQICHENQSPAPLVWCEKSVWRIHIHFIWIQGFLVIPATESQELFKDLKSFFLIPLEKKFLIL
jgi:hypothetical protein